MFKTDGGMTEGERVDDGQPRVPYVGMLLKSAFFLVFYFVFFFSWVREVAFCWKN